MNKANVLYFYNKGYTRGVGEVVIDLPTHKVPLDDIIKEAERAIGDRYDDYDIDQIYFNRRKGVVR